MCAYRKLHIIKCTVWWIFKKQTPKWRPRILSEFQKSTFDTSQSLVTTSCPRQTLLQFLASLITFVLFKKQKKTFILLKLYSIYSFFCLAFLLSNLFLRFFYAFVGSKTSLFSLLHSMYSIIWLSHNLFFSFFCQWFLAYFHPV